MPDSSFWGGLILNLREEQQISQRTLASLARVSRTTLRKLESGGVAGDVEVIERLLGCLGYELEALKIDSKQREFPGAVYRTPERRSKLAVMRILSMDLSQSSCIQGLSR